MVSRNETTRDEMTDFVLPLFDLEEECCSCNFFSLIAKKVVCEDSDGKIIEYGPRQFEDLPVWFSEDVEKMTIYLYDDIVYNGGSTIKVFPNKNCEWIGALMNDVSLRDSTKFGLRVESCDNMIGASICFASEGVIVCEEDVDPVALTEAQAYVDSLAAQSRINL